MASSNEQAIARLLNSGRMPQNNDEGLLSYFEDYFFEGVDELPRSKYFAHIDRKMLWIYLLWLLITTECNEELDDNELDLQMDDIEMEVEVEVDDMTHKLEDHFDH